MAGFGIEVGRDAPGAGVDHGDGLLPEPHTRRRELGVRQPHFVRLLLSEHHVELREPEHERVRAVDQRDLHLIVEFVGEPAG